jgi:hypothetical protein
LNQLINEKNELTGETNENPQDFEQYLLNDVIAEKVNVEDEVAAFLTAYQDTNKVAVPEDKSVDTQLTPGQLEEQLGEAQFEFSNYLKEVVSEEIDLTEFKNLNEKYDKYINANNALAQYEGQGVEPVSTSFIEYFKNEIDVNRDLELSDEVKVALGYVDESVKELTLAEIQENLRVTNEAFQDNYTSFLNSFDGEIDLQEFSELLPSFYEMQAAEVAYAEAHNYEPWLSTLGDKILEELDLNQNNLTPELSEFINKSNEFGFKLDGEDQTVGQSVFGAKTDNKYEAEYLYRKNSFDLMFQEIAVDNNEISPKQADILTGLYYHYASDARTVYEVSIGNEDFNDQTVPFEDYLLANKGKNVAISPEYQAILDQINNKA